FKLRSASPIELATNQSFAYMVPLSTANLKIIYPAHPDLTTTTFDGTWDMYLNVPTAQPSFVIYDGDFDYGSYDCSVNDSDDADTPNGVDFPWVVPGSNLAEGIATTTLGCVNSAKQPVTGPEGQVYTSGAPADNSIGASYRRDPAVVYEVTAPDGKVYPNTNPSGNMEWEQFLISSDRSVAADHYTNAPLPAGTYKVHVSGLDLSNLNAWHLAYDAVCIHEDGSPCVQVLHPFRIGDTVWADTNGNGVQDQGEAGISGVTLTLLDTNGNALLNGTATTDANGNYSFGVNAGTYTVQVDASNFEAGGVLSGYSPTTAGGNTQTNAVNTENILTYDFGYRLPFASLGDLVWEDANGNGIQDDGEAGSAGVTVALLGSDGATVVATTTTDTAGNYSFTGLMPGTYFVQILTPSEMVFTKAYAGSDDAADSDVDASGKTAAITLGAGETNTSVDAGLKPNVNYCSYIRSPGFWKNYSNHMSDAAFQNLLSHTQDFSYLTVSQARTILKTNNGTTKVGISQLGGVNASYLKFLLSAELNAAWNGQDNAASPNGMFGNGSYQGTNMTVNQVLHQAYLDRYKFSSTQKGYLQYLGSDGENVNQDMCLVQP
ncbi:MAG TPA: SdrD B-like domain-containing protein, partial [Anaerolineales bacterium]|nr:SdrD B-like domain-containing protein [Anaerolineales bacterium]